MIDRVRPDLAQGRCGVLIMAHGTPQSLEDVERFYTEIRKNHRPSREALEELRRRYAAIGECSPLAQITSRQVASVKATLDEAYPERFVVCGAMKFSEPRIEDSVKDLVGHGVERIVGVILAPHSTEVSTGDYTRRAREALGSVPAGENPIGLEMIENWFAEAELIDMLSEGVENCIVSPSSRSSEHGGTSSEHGGTSSEHGGTSFEHDRAAHVLFTAHSVPIGATSDDYAKQVQMTAQLVADRVGISRWSVAWQSAGMSGGSWLGPDLREAVASVVDNQIPNADLRTVVVCPAGFVSDHLEVLYDLDIEVRSEIESRGLRYVRTPSLNDDPRLASMIARLVAERTVSRGAGPASPGPKR